jgi:membrane carboxypeptidase/penicillin-binding protein PbpC
MILDVRTSFMTQDGKAYIPENYDLVEHGPVLTREALASSLNIPAVNALEHIGLSALFDISGKMGITTFEDPDAYDLSLALGGGAVRLIDLTAAYGAFASRGFRVEPRLILEAHDMQGKTVYTAPEPLRSQVLDERIAWLVSDILSDRDARRLGFGANSILQLDRPAAVKTGTTSNFHDNWTVGYTPDLVVGVWSGNTDYQPMREINGLTGAAPIWHEFMRAVLSGQPQSSFERPPGLVQAEVCALSGLLPTQACPYRRMEWFLAGTEPHQEDNFYREVFLDKETRILANAKTLPENRVREVVLDLPLQAHQWARGRGLRLYADLLPTAGAYAEPALPGKPASEIDQSLTELRLVAPAGGSVYHLAAGFSATAQRIQLEAVGTPDIRDVALWVDGIRVGENGQASYRLWWTLTVGEHQVWAEGIGPNGKPVKSQVAVIRVIQ